MRPVALTARSLALALTVAACRLPAAPAAPAAPVVWSQWVWTDADRAPLAALRARRPDAVAAVHVATVHHGTDGFTNTLALAPTVVDAPRAIVLRLDDDVWPAIEAGAPGLDDAVGRVLTLARSRGPWVEVQLDADAPVRLLPAWANALAGLRRGPLAGETLWVTSLVAHVEDPRFAALIGPSVDGHVLQVFDTGDDPVDAARVVAAVEAAHVPYRWGLGAFERGGAHPTAHGAWFDRTPCAPPWCRGKLVFPAGNPWVDRFDGAGSNAATPGVRSGG